jgi:hypothetical protein
MNDKIPNKKLEERVVLMYDHAQTAATLSVKLWKCPVGRSFVLDRVVYVNPTGLATDASNYFVGELKNTTTSAVMDTILNTNSAGGAAVTANAFATGALSATAANQWLAANDEMSLVLTKTGTQTLPAGHIVIEGRLL